MQLSAISRVFLAHVFKQSQGQNNIGLAFRATLNKINL